MKKNERISELKKDIKSLKEELKETKELVNLLGTEAIKWKRMYKKLYTDYSNLMKEKQMFTNTRPQKIVNVEIKGDLIFKPKNNFYKDVSLDESSESIINEINTTTKRKIEEYNKISDESSDSLLQPIPGVNKTDEVSLECLDISGPLEPMNLSDSNEKLKKKRRRRKKY